MLSPNSDCERSPLSLQYECDSRFSREKAPERVLELWVFALSQIANRVMRAARVSRGA